MKMFQSKKINTENNESAAIWKKSQTYNRTILHPIFMDLFYIWGYSTWQYASKMSHSIQIVTAHRIIGFFRKEWQTHDWDAVLYA